MFSVYMTNLDDLISKITGWIGAIIPLLFSFAVLFFLWGLVKFMMNAGDEKAQEEGKRVMVWGVIILFVMSTFWGIVAFMQDTADLPSSGATVPTAPTIVPIR